MAFYWHFIGILCGILLAEFDVMVLITKMNDVVTLVVVVHAEKLWFLQEDMCR